MGKKKKASNKLAKMSDEEKARYLQHRAEIEEEAKRRKQELVATYLKNKLKKEEAFTRINLAKINQEWRNILRKVKIKELHEDLEALEKWIDETVNRKNECIKHLMVDLDQGELQYNRNLSKHLTQIDSMLQFHKNELIELKSSYDQQLIDTLERAGKEELQILNTADRNEKHLQMIIYQTEMDDNKYFQEDHNKYYKKLHDITSTFIINYDDLKAKKDLQMGSLWKQMNEVLSDYLTRTESKRKEYAVMKSVDAEYSASIAKNYEILEQQTDLITRLKAQLINMKKLYEDRISELKEKKVKYKKIFLGKRNRLIADKNLDKSQLTKLTSISNGVIEDLKSIVSKGEHILNLVSMCRKYQKEEEKVDPWNGYIFDQNSVTKDTEDYETLDKFWWLYNQAVIDCTNLKAEKNKLEEENAAMKVQIKKYLSEVYYSGETRTFETISKIASESNIIVVNSKFPLACFR